MNKDNSNQEKMHHRMLFLASIAFPRSPLHRNALTKALKFAQTSRQAFHVFRIAPEGSQLQLDALLKVWIKSKSLEEWLAFCRQIPKDCILYCTALDLAFSLVQNVNQWLLTYLLMPVNDRRKWLALTYVAVYQTSVQELNHMFLTT